MVQAAAFILQLAKKDSDHLVGLGQQRHSQKKPQKRPVPQRIPQRCPERLPLNPPLPCLFHFRQSQRQHGGNAIAEHRQQRRQGIVLLCDQGEDTSSQQQPHHTQTVTNSKHPLTLMPPAGQIQNTGIHAGIPGQHHAEQDTLQQETGKPLRLPEDELRNKIQAGTEAHGLSVSDPVGHHAPGYFQHQGQRQGNSLNQGNLKQRDAPGLTVQGGNGAVKYHALQQGNGIQQIDIFLHKDGPFQMVSMPNRPRFRGACAPLSEENASNQMGRSMAVPRSRYNLYSNVTVPYAIGIVNVRFRRPHGKPTAIKNQALRPNRKT